MRVGWERVVTATVKSAYLPAGIFVASHGILMNRQNCVGLQQNSPIIASIKAVAGCRPMIAASR
jgi:hypothetical protein